MGVGDNSTNLYMTVVSTSQQHIVSEPIPQDHAGGGECKLAYILGRYRGLGAKGCIVLAFGASLSFKLP